MSRAVSIYLTSAYALSIALSLVIGLTGGHQSSLIGFGLLTMFLPAAAMAVACLATGEPLAIDWGRCPLRYVPVAILLLPLLMHAAMLPAMTTLEGRLPWQDWLAPQADGLFHTPAARAWGDLALPGLLARVALNAGLGLIVVSLFAVFEEIGWRAWLLPRLGTVWRAARRGHHLGPLGVLAHAVRALGHPSSRWRLDRAHRDDHADWDRRFGPGPRLAVAADREHLDRRPCAWRLQ